MKDDNKICVLKPGTKVHVIDNLGNLRWKGVVRRFSVSYLVPIPAYEIEVEERKDFVTICNYLWQVIPAPEPMWEVIEGYRAHATKKKGVFAGDRVIFTSLKDKRHHDVARACIVRVKDTKAAAEKLAAFLNEIEAE